MIAYTIEAALQAQCVDEVIVTTDDEEIAEVSRKYGASVPFIRPACLATDNASAVDVYLHAVEWIMEQQKREIDKFMVLLPTSPLRTAKDIDAANDFFSEKNAMTLIGVKEAEIPPSWYMSIDKEFNLKPSGFGAQECMKNRQENQKYGIVCGAIYILDYNLLKEKRTYYADDTIAFFLTEKHGIDIDNKSDFEYAEYLMSHH